MSPALDLERLRAETPGTAEVAHLNNAGSALPPDQVVDAVVAFLRREAEIGGYEAHAEANEVIEGTYGSVARLINADPSEIAFIENATRAWDMAFYAIDFKAGDRILTSQAEYASNAIAFLQRAKTHGVVVDVVPDGPDGSLSTDALKGLLDERVKLIAVNHVPSQNGLVNPVAEIGAVAREAGVLYLLDACQSIGQLPVDVAEIGCHLLSATGRKFLRGPRGTGFLYVDSAILDQLEPPFLDLHAAEWTAPDRYEMRPDARRFETWETSYAGRVGLGVAVEYAMAVGVPAIQARNRVLAERLRSGLATLPGVRVHDRGSRKSAITSFTVDGADPFEVRDHLSHASINVSVTTSATAMFDMPGLGLPAVVRASPHYYNAESEIDSLLTSLEDFRKAQSA
jgi:cysteine desulfurase / selenocysteine lyase